MVKKVKTTEKSNHAEPVFSYRWDITTADNGFVGSFSKFPKKFDVDGGEEAHLVFGDPVSLLMWFARSLGVPLEYSPVVSALGQQVEEEASA